ncbi:MAG: hypothetical protein J7M14_06895, partial [Planctomycetes bacterium]|nr:hypothetical protein [Planctomycetota bacterium]
LTSDIQCSSESLPNLKIGRNVVTLREQGRSKNRSRVNLQWTQQSLRKVKDDAGAWGWGEIHTIASGENLLLPAIAAGPRGRLAAAWQQGLRGEKSQVHISLAHGRNAAFAPLCTVKPRGVSAAHPALAFVGDDLWAAWQQGANVDTTGISVSRIVDGHARKAVRISAARSKEPARFPMLSAAGRAGLIAVWQRGYGAVVRRYSNRRWAKPHAITGFLPSLCTDSNGVAHVLSRGDGNGFETCYHRLSPGGAQSKPLFFPPAWITSVGRGSVAAGTGGTLYAAWAAHRVADRGSIFLRTMQAGKAWSRVMQVSDPIEPAAKYPSITVVGSCLHLVWMDLRSGASAVFWKQYDGRKWSADIRLSADGAAAMHPRISSTARGDVHVVWYEPSGDQAGIRIRSLLR